MKENKTKKEIFGETFIRALAVFCALAVVYCTVTIAYKNTTSTAVNAPTADTTPEYYAPDAETDSSTDNTVAPEAPTQSENDSTASDTQTDTQTAVKPEDKQETTDKANPYDEKAEIVKLYNTSVNRVKKEAKSLTRNYKKLNSMDEYLQLPSAIESIGRSAINTFVKGTDEPQTWTKAEDIAIIFPVGKESYSSNLTADMVEKATLKDNGSTYQIEMKLYNDKLTSPAKGKGYAGVFNTVTASTFEEISIPTVTFNTVNVNGINGYISCTIDKTTGRVIKANYKNADILHLGVKVAFSEFEVQFALNAEEDYTITY